MRFTDTDASKRLMLDAYLVSRIVFVEHTHTHTLCFGTSQLQPSLLECLFHLQSLAGAMCWRIYHCVWVGLKQGHYSRDQDAWEGASA